MTADTNQSSTKNFYMRDGKTWYRFTTGREIQITPIPPLFATELESAFPMPEPPMQKIPTADGTDFILEPNYASPIYTAAVEKRNAAFNRAAQEFVIAEGTVIDITPEIESEVEKKRETLRRFGAKPHEDVKYCYVAYILAASNEDVSNLVDAISGRSKPTEGAIARAIESFQSDLARS